MSIVQHERDKCIGCGACTIIYPEAWKMIKDGKSDLLFCEEKTGNIQIKKIISETDQELHQEAAESCPVNCIHLFNDKGGKII